MYSKTEEKCMNFEKKRVMLKNIAGGMCRI